MSSITPKSFFKSFCMSMTTRGYEPEQNVLQDDLEAGKGVKRLKYQRIKVISTGVLQLGSSSGQGGSDHDTQGDVRDPGTTNQLGERGSRTRLPGSNHDVEEEEIVDPEAGNQLEEDRRIDMSAVDLALAVRVLPRVLPQQANNPNEDSLAPVVQENATQGVLPHQANNPDGVRKSALKISLLVFGISCGGIYSIFPLKKGQYDKHLLMACALLVMVTMISSVVLMGLAFTGSTKEWLIRMFDKAKYIPLVLLTLTGLTTGITFLVSLK